MYHSLKTLQYFLKSCMIKLSPLQFQIKCKRLKQWRFRKYIKLPNQNILASTMTKLSMTRGKGVTVYPWMTQMTDLTPTSKKAQNQSPKNVLKNLFKEKHLLQVRKTTSRIKFFVRRLKKIHIGSTFFVIFNKEESRKQVRKLIASNKNFTTNLREGKIRTKIW